MAKRIVHILESVEIETEHAHALPELDGLLQPLMQEHPIGQARQRVVVRHMRHARFDAPLLGDVLVRGDCASTRHRLVHDDDDSPVAQFLNARRGGIRVAGLLPLTPVLVRGAARIQSPGNAVLQDLDHGCSRLHERRR